MKESNTLSKVKITVWVESEGGKAIVNKGMMPSIFLKNIFSKISERK